MSTITASCLISIANLRSIRITIWIRRRESFSSSPREHNNDKLILHRKSLRNCKGRFACSPSACGFTIYSALIAFTHIVYRNSSRTRRNKSLGDNCQSTKIRWDTLRTVRDANKWIVRLRVFLAVVKREARWKRGLVWKKL